MHHAIFGTHTKKLFIVYVNFQVNWMSCIFSDNPAVIPFITPHISQTSCSLHGAFPINRTSVNVALGLWASSNTRPGEIFSGELLFSLGLNFLKQSHVHPADNSAFHLPYTCPETMSYNQLPCNRSGEGVGLRSQIVYLHFFNSL